MHRDEKGEEQEVKGKAKEGERTIESPRQKRMRIARLFKILQKAS